MKEVRDIQIVAICIISTWGLYVCEEMDTGACYLSCMTGAQCLITRHIYTEHLLRAEWPEH